MLRSNSIGKCNSFVDIISQNHDALSINRSFSNFFSSQFLKLRKNFFVHLLKKTFTRCNKHRTGIFIMFRLGKEISCCKGRHCTIICYNQDLTWASKHIQPYFSEYQPFCCLYINITRTNNFVHSGNAFCSVCESSYGLRTPYPIDATDLRNFCCSKNM